MVGHPAQATHQARRMTRTCDLCPEPAAVFLPGDAGERCDLFMLRREVKLRAWCLCCWHKRFGSAAA